MNILFGKKKAEKIAVAGPEIGQNFAQEVLDLEGELRFACTMEKVKSLMKLYTKAIEFYEAEQNPRYVQYQERMQGLLLRKDVAKLLASTVKNTEKRMSVSELPVERTCEKVVQGHIGETSTVVKKVVENFKRQSENLSQRVESRKKNRILLQNRVLKALESDQYDRSGGEAKPSQAEVFEFEVERIMERFVEDRNAVKKEIEEKYNEHISEIQGMQGDVFKSLMKEIKKNMQIEIEEKVKGLEVKRADEMALAKRKLVNVNRNK